MRGVQREGGKDVTPRLRLVRPLGQGGMGVLWVAEHRALGNEVVVKFLSEELADDPSAAKRIAREAAAAARVKSPHVVQVLDHGVTDGTPFVVMELLEGCDLRAHLETRGRLSPEETTQVVNQLAKALGKTHAAGIVHRDVKPSNIFLLDGEPEIFVKLLDFGLALRTASTEGSTTGTRHCAGTPPYMSPEQIVGGKIDARSDVWSLGVVAFQCLTGKRPFGGETLGAVALAIHTLPPPRMTDIRPELPGKIDEWFARTCTHSRDARFASAVEAAEAFALALGTTVPGARLQSSAETRAREDRTVSGDFALTRARAGAAKQRWTSRAVVGAVTLAMVIAAAVGAYRDTSRASFKHAARSEEPALQAIQPEAINERMPEPAPLAPPDDISKEARPPVARTSHPTLAQATSARATAPLATALASSGAVSSPASASPPPIDQKHGARHAFELPDERY